MGYVENLLLEKLGEHQAFLIHHRMLGEHENVASCLAVISELEYVLGILEHNKTYLLY